MEINVDSNVICILILLVGIFIGVGLQDASEAHNYRKNFDLGLKDGKHYVPLNFSADDNTKKTAGYLNGYLYGFPYTGNNYTGIQNHTLIIRFEP